MTGPNEGVGIFGELCGARTASNVLGKLTHKGYSRRAVCNRWAQHDGKHRQVAGKTFEVIYEFGDDEIEVAAKKGSK